MTATATEPTPPTLFQRDPTTGLEIGRVYPRLPNGRVDWRALLNPTHIVFNSKNEKTAAEIAAAYGAPAKSLVYADIAAKQPVDDKHIVVLLAGWLELAELRGYTSSVPTHLQVSQGIVVAAHEIDWIPNEEDPKGKKTGATADATIENTGGFAFLATMAGNRAMVRAIRRGLGINILAYDEIAKAGDHLPESGAGSTNSQSAAGSSSTSFSSVGLPVPSLIKWASEGGFSFDLVKKGAVKRWAKETASLAADATFQRNIKSDPSTWTRFEDVPPGDCLTLIDAIRKAIAEKQKKAEEAAGGKAK